RQVSTAGDRPAWLASGRRAARHLRTRDVSLPAVAVLVVAGPRAAALGLVRSAIVQLAVLHRPSDLCIAVLAADHLAADWAWARWLPHIAHGSAALVGSSPPGRAAVVATFEDRDRQAGPAAQRLTIHLPQL